MIDPRDWEAPPALPLKPSTGCAVMNKVREHVSSRYQMREPLRIDENGVKIYPPGYAEGVWPQRIGDIYDA